jgi:hypothetical protein
LFLDFFFLSLFQFRRRDLLLFVPPRFPGDTGNPLRHARKRSCLSSSPADREMRITAVFFIFIILFSIYLFVCLFGLANAAELRALVVLSLALCL